MNENMLTNHLQKIFPLDVSKIIGKFTGAMCTDCGTRFACGDKASICQACLDEIMQQPMPEDSPPQGLCNECREFEATRYVADLQLCDECEYPAET